MIVVTTISWGNSYMASVLETNVPWYVQWLYHYEINPEISKYNITNEHETFVFPRAGEYFLSNMTGISWIYVKILSEDFHYFVNDCLR